MLWEELEKRIKDMAGKVDYIYKRMKRKEKKAPQKSYITDEKITQILQKYKEKINSHTHFTSEGKDNIRKCLEKFGSDNLLQAITKKSNDKFFMENNAKRGITWMFKSLTRIRTYIEEEAPKTINDMYKTL